MENIGKKVWVIAEGYIPAPGPNTSHKMISHETACILNATDKDAHIEVHIYYSDKEPVGPYKLTVPARRTHHMRFNDLQDPSPVPQETDYASVFISDVPVVVQHTRLDSRQTEHSLMSTMAYAES